MAGGMGDVDGEGLKISNDLEDRKRERERERDVEMCRGRRAPRRSGD